MTDPVTPIPYVEKLDPAKRYLMDYVFSWQRPRPRRFADLGGVWGVDGAYSLHAMIDHGCKQGFLVDTHLNPRIRDYAERTPGLTLIQGNFGDPEVAAQVPQVDCVFMFDVLLHQVRPHWHEVMAMYAAKTPLLVIYNQQFTASPWPGRSGSR